MVSEDNNNNVNNINNNNYKKDINKIKSNKSHGSDIKIFDDIEFLNDTFGKNAMAECIEYLTRLKKSA